MLTEYLADLQKSNNCFFFCNVYSTPMGIEPLTRRTTTLGFSLLLTRDYDVPEKSSTCRAGLRVKMKPRRLGFADETLV